MQQGLLLNKSMKIKLAQLKKNNFHLAYCWVSGTKAAGGSSQCLKWAQIVMFCLSRRFLYRKPPQFLFCSWTDHENPQCCRLTHPHEWEKLKAPFFFSPFGGLKVQQGPFCKFLLHFPIPGAVCLDIGEPKADAPELWVFVMLGIVTDSAGHQNSKSILVICAGISTF